MRMWTLDEPCMFFFLSWAARANGVQWGTNVLFFYLFPWGLYHCSTLTARHRIVVSQRRAGKMRWARHTYLTHTLAPAAVSPIFVVLFKRPFPCSRDKNNTSNLVIISLSWSWLSLVINRPERSRAWTSDLLSWWAYETFSSRTDPNVYFFSRANAQPTAALSVSNQNGGSNRNLWNPVSVPARLALRYPVNNTSAGPQMHERSGK